MSVWEELNRSRSVLWPAAADDAYTVWFHAERRCAAALKAWSTAAPEARAAAYRGYRVALRLEEMAAAELESQHARRMAA